MYGRILQTVGVLASLAAIQLEIYHGGDVYLILATAGSVVFAVGTKVHYFLILKKERKEKPKKVNWPVD